MTLVVLQWCISANAWPSNAATAVILEIGVHLALLSALITDTRMRSSVCVQNLVVIYATLMWIYLQKPGIAFNLGGSPMALEDAESLFWPPFLAASLWAYSQLVNKNVMILLFLSIAVIQPAIGFVDLRSTWHVRWAAWAVVVCVVCGFACAIWSLTLEKAERARKFMSKPETGEPLPR